MTMEYLMFKWIHIISATLLFGVGLGSAFYKYQIDKSKNISAITVVNKNVVLADWLFTTPTLFIQPITGFILVLNTGYDLSYMWLSLSIVLFIIAGLCWLPVVFLQIKMRNLSLVAFKSNTCLPEIYWHYTKIWFYLGIPAFISMLGIFYLMTNKPILI